jgi:hypothetical protein
MPKQTEQKSKKNLSGGKGFKRQGKEISGHRKNREITTAYVEDVLANEKVPEIILARVIKVLGGARMQVQTVTGDTVTAAMRNLLRCKGNQAKKGGNPIAAMPGTFVMLQQEEYGSQIIGVLSRVQIKALIPKFPAAPAAFFAEGEEAADDGIEWDLSEEGEGEGAAASDDEDVDIDAI